MFLKVNFVQDFTHLVSLMFMLFRTLFSFNKRSFSSNLDDNLVIPQASEQSNVRQEFNGNQQDESFFAGELEGEDDFKDDSLEEEGFSRSHKASLGSSYLGMYIMQPELREIWRELYRGQYHLANYYV